MYAIEHLFLSSIPKFIDQFKQKYITEIMKLKLCIVLIFFAFQTILLNGQTVKIDWPELKDSANLVDTHSKPIKYQEKKIYDFPSVGVRISNKFAGARLNAVQLENDSTFNCLILPENFPINMSPWYSFKVWAEDSRTIYFDLHYKHGKHRYFPKLSKDGIQWTQIESSDLFTKPSDSTALFRVQIGPDTTWISGQELMTTQVVSQWTNKLAEKPFVNKHTIGYSTLKKPITALTVSESKGKNMLIILSRQHPPELTGFKEMMAFVETLCGSSGKAKKFRKKFEVIIVPVMNPDGVDNGHWRHNAGGIDMNRDWRHFNQPETAAFRKFVLKEIKKQNAIPRYGIDFHSTQTDIFYLPSEETLPGGKGISMTWLNNINEKFPQNPFNPEPSGVEGQISKNWFLHELKIEAITYEVGDTTDREVIKKRGKESALQLIKILLKEYKNK